MQPVKAPREDGDYPDRQLDCLGAIESKVQQLMEEVTRAGWAREEAAAALIEAAYHLMTAATENRTQDQGVADP